MYAKTNDPRIAETYQAHRVQHGVLDSIRFTARDLGMSSVQVARELDLTKYFLEHRLGY